MDADLGMFTEKLGDLLGLVRREVVGDDVDLFALGLVGTMSARKATNSAEV